MPPANAATADEPTAPATPAAPPQPAAVPATATARRQALVTLRDEIRQLGDIAEGQMSQEQENRLAAALGEFEPLAQAVQADETRADQIQRVRQTATGSAPGADVPGQINRDNPFNVDLRTTSNADLRDRSLRVAEQRGDLLTNVQQKHFERLVRTQTANTDGASIARRTLVTETDEYRSAFLKGMAGRYDYTPEESRALSAYHDLRQEFRVANEGTGSAGGYGVPVLIDPTIILTSGAAAAPLLDISRIITVTTNVWHGVTSAGFSWAFQAESAVVADNSPTLGQPTIPVYTGRGFIPYTLEVGDDYPGFQEEMAKLMAQGYLNLMAVKTMTGSGSAEPTGIFTRMANTTTAPAHVTVTTAGTLSAADVRAAWQALPELFRPNAHWAMNVEVENIIRAFGNNLALSDYTVNLGAGGVGTLTGRPIVLSDYAPSFTNVTTAESALVVGNFQHYIIVQRAGMQVELVPHLFDPTTGRPLGQRGWFAWARVGADADTPNAFRVLSNT